MFFGCFNLDCIDVSGWNTLIERSTKDTFACMRSLRSLAIGDGWTINLAEMGLGVRYPGIDSLDMPPWAVVYDAAVSSVSLKDVPLGTAATYYLDSRCAPKP